MSMATVMTTTTQWHWQKSIKFHLISQFDKFMHKMYIIQHYLSVIICVFRFKLTHLLATFQFYSVEWQKFSWNPNWIYKIFSLANKLNENLRKKWTFRRLQNPSGLAITIKKTKITTRKYMRLETSVHTIHAYSWQIFNWSSNFFLFVSVCFVFFQYKITEPFASKQRNI